MTNGKGGGETTRLFTPLCSSSRTMRAHRSQWKAGRFSTLSPTAFAQRLRGRRKRPTVAHEFQATPTSAPSSRERGSKSPSTSRKRDSAGSWSSIARMKTAWSSPLRVRGFFAPPGRQTRKHRITIYSMNGKRKKRTLIPYSMNVLDYPCTMSMYEKESLAAEAKLKAEREKQKPPKRTVQN